MRRLFRYLLLVLLTLSGLLAAALALNWAPDLPVASLTARWAPPPSTFVEVGGMKVHMRDEGRRDDPLPLVLIHGTSASLHTWEPWVAELRKTRRVVTLDIPGYGLTGPFPQSDYRIARYTAFLKDFLDVLKLERIIIGGNSLGGHIAWAFALAEPQRVDRLILVDSAGYPFTSTSIPLGFQLARIPALRPIMQNVLPRSVVRQSVENVYGDPARVTEALVDRYYDLARREGNRRALGETFEQRRHDLGTDAPRIKQLKLPTLVLWGREDRLIPLTNAEDFGRDIAGSKVVVFPGLGHVPHEEDPAATLVPVMDFIRSAP